MIDMPPFHLAFPVHDLTAAESFYAGLLGCRIGRRSPHWIDFDFFGHQITAHLKPEACAAVDKNAVDGDAVPVRHFGAVLDWEDWEALSHRLDDAGVDFIIRPRVRFAGKPGEQGTFFLGDPSGNALEFKTFRNRASLFDPGEADDYA